jgi:hypothetical protein
MHCNGTCTDLFFNNSCLSIISTIDKKLVSRIRITTQQTIVVEGCLLLLLGDIVYNGLLRNYAVRVLLLVTVGLFRNVMYIRKTFSPR